jgi:hypothetical protein
MRFRLERSLEAWSKEAGYHYYSVPSQYDINIVRSQALISKLRTYGLTTEALVTLASFYRNYLEESVCLADNLRILCWYWPSGEQVIYPINSKGSIYIGNSPEFWFDYYPFLKRIPNRDWVYECNLHQHASTLIYTTENRKFPFYIGGQTHFGHFIVDKYSPLLSLRNVCSQISFGSFLLPFGHEGITRDLLVFLWRYLNVDGKQSQANKQCLFNSLPKQSGVYSIGHQLWIPADNHRPDSIILANKTFYPLQSRDLSGIPPSSCAAGLNRRSIAYVSRVPQSSVEHDRISNYRELAGFVKDFNIHHIYPNNLSLNERLKLFSLYDTFICDSGSCCLNALVFSRPDALVYQFQSRRLLADSSMLATSQHYKGVPLFGSRLRSLLGAPRIESRSNTWYDKIDVDVEKLQALLV